MLRYYVFAADSQGATSRFPAFEDPRNSSEYLGTVIFDPGLTNPLPVFQLFVQDPVAATNGIGTRGSVYYDGEFYDNVGVGVHGQTTTEVFPKRSMNIGFNRGSSFRWDRTGATMMNVPPIPFTSTLSTSRPIPSPWNSTVNSPRKAGMAYPPSAIFRSS